MAILVTTTFLMIPILIKESLGVTVTIKGSSQYIVPGQPFTFTCMFTPSDIRIPKSLIKDGQDFLKVQLSNDGSGRCFNVISAPPVLCNPSYCSCSEEGDVFTAAWTLTSITNTTAWECKEGVYRSSELWLKVAVPVDSVVLEGISGSHINVVAGQISTLTCVTKATRPRSYIQWYIGHDNYKVNSTSTVTTDQDEMSSVRSVLTFTPTRNHANQAVNCKAYNINPDTTVELVNKPILNVQYLPPNPTATIKDVGNIFSINEGKSVTLQCDIVGGNPLAVINWICFGGTVTNTTVSGRARTNITFTASRSLNGKICICSATHPAGHIQNDSVQINVTYGPKLVSLQPPNNFYIVNETSNLGPIKCSADCNPNCSFTWTRPGSPTIDGPVLQINSIKKEQDGNYFCTASNNLGTNTSGNIVVTVNYSPKSVSLQPTNLTYTVNENHSLGPIQCSADCNPNCSFTWTRPGSSSVNGPILQINSIEKGQAGNYFCTASNNLGTKQSGNVVVTVNYVTVTIKGSSQYIIPGQPFTFTCMFSPSDIRTSKVLIKDRNDFRKVQLSNDGSGNCYNVTSAAELCNPSYCSCSEQGGVFTATWTFSSITNTTTWECKEESYRSSELTMKIAVPVDYVALEDISGSQINVVAGQILTLSCVTKATRPRSYIQWYIGHDNYTVNSTTTVTTHQDEMSSVRSVLTFTPTRKQINLSVNCKAYNIDPNTTVEVVNKPRINLLYGPETVTLNPSSKHYSTTEEGIVPDITCSTDCKPSCNYRWTKDGQVTSHGSGSTLSLRNINRNDTGVYRCTAWNVYNTSHSEDININVFYLDLYTMTSTETYESTQDIILACDARGNPSDIVFQPWTQKVSSKIIRSLAGSITSNTTVLRVPYSSYQDHGIYTCYADNKYGTLPKGKDTTVIVNDKPVIIDTVVTQEQSRRGEIIVDFYSVPKPLKVEWLQKGSIISLSEKYRQNNVVVEIQLTLHDVKVKLEGYRAKLRISSLTDSDYGTYVLRIENDKGIASQQIEFKPKDEYKLIIGLSVGIVIPVLIAAVAITMYIYRRQKQQNQTDKVGEITHYEDIDSKRDDANVYQGISLEGIENSQELSTHVDEYEHVADKLELKECQQTHHKDAESTQMKSMYMNTTVNT